MGVKLDRELVSWIFSRSISRFNQQQGINKTISIGNNNKTPTTFKFKHRHQQHGVSDLLCCLKNKNAFFSFLFSRCYSRSSSERKVDLLLAKPKENTIDLNMNTQSQRQDLMIPTATMYENERSKFLGEDDKALDLSSSTSADSKETESQTSTANSSLQAQGFQSNLSQKLDFNTIQSIVETSSSCLLNGGVIAVPTDTIYGVACLAQNPFAVERIYTIKGRHQEKPIAISVAQISDIYKWSKVTVSKELLADLLPGPVTVVFERSHALNPTFNPHTSLIGIRIPDNRFMQSLAKQCDSPIALTSANISGSSSCLHAQEFKSLWPRLDLVVNGGRLSDTEESRLGSTVVDLSESGTFKIIRPGSAHTATCRCLRDKHKLLERGNTVSPDR